MKEFVDVRMSCLGLLLVFVAGYPTLGVATENHEAGERYALIERIPAPGTNWDYLAVDAVARRLYIAHDGVAALDLDTHKFTAHIVPGQLTHGVLPLGGGLVAVDDSGDSMVTLFEGSTGKVRARIHVPKSSTKKGFHDPDALVYDTKTGLLIAVNGDSSDLVLIDTAKPAVVGTIAIGGDLEFPVADGKGTLYVNIASTNQIAVVDIPKRKLVKKYDLVGCKEPTGIAFDARDNLLISVCHDGAVKFVDAASGRNIETLHVGAGPDAVLFDPLRRLVLVPSGETGTLSVIAVRSHTQFKILQTLQTQVGARTAALDPPTGRVYVPCAQLNPPTATFPFHSAIEGTFQIIVIAPM